MNNKLVILVLGAVALLTAGCNREQRDSALASVRSLQSSGAAYAAVLPSTPGIPAQDAPAQGLPPGGGAPGAPPAGAPPVAGGGAQPPAGGAAAADPNAKQKTPDEIIEEFVKSDPRDILVAKTKDLEERKTEPWNEERPDTFIPETGRRDPMSVAIDKVPKELLPKRTGDDDSDFETYLYTQFATQIMNSVSRTLRCHSVIQIGLEKYAQMSFSESGDGGGGGGGTGAGRGGRGGNRGENRFVVSEGSGFSQYINGFEMSLTIVSISTSEVVVDVTVAAVGTNISVDKQLVFIPRS